MKFTAEISCYESRIGFEENDEDNQEFERHFESDEATATVTVTVQRRASSVAPSRRVSSKKSLSRISEEEMMELYKMSFGGGPPKSSRAAQEEEEIRKKLMRKPSRKISREGDYLVVQERLGVLMSQTGAQQVRENRYLINSDEYRSIIKSMN